jgi:hypothetical protein
VLLRLRVGTRVNDAVVFAKNGGKQLRCRDEFSGGLVLS